MIYLHWKIKYLPKLAHNTFPTYFNSYRHFFCEKNIIYSLRNHTESKKNYYDYLRRRQLQL